MRERWTVRWFRRRALLYHLLLLVIDPLCGWAAWWQINRASDGNTLSYLYAFEWPVFAVLAVVGWWQLIHEAPADVDARKIERARRAATKGPFVPPAADAPSGFARPLAPGSAGAVGAGGGRGGVLVRVDDRTGELVEVALGQAGDEGEVGGSLPVHALSSYNAYLARLAASGGRKTWRNPHGRPDRT